MEIPDSRDGNPKIWRLRSGYLENWPDWDAHDIVSVGWDIGPIRGDVTNEQAITDHYDTLDGVGSEIENRIIDRYFGPDNDGDPSNAYGTVRTVTATRTDRYFAPGDYVVVFGHKIQGEPVIHGVARLQEYIGDTKPVKKESHPYQWKVEYLAKGPVRKRDLSGKFDGGDVNLFLRPTLWEFHDATTEDIEDLIDEIQELRKQGKDISLSNLHFDYKEKHMQSYIGDNIAQLDERIVDMTPEFWINADNRADFYCELENDETLLIETKQNHATTGHLKQLTDYIREYENEKTEKPIGMLVAPGFHQDTIEKAPEEGIELKKFIPSAEFEPVEQT